MVKRKEYLKKVKRIVVKVGTSVITTESGRLDPSQLKNLVSQVARLKSQGYQMLLVTSGAIAAGVERLGLKKRPTAIPELQAAAAIGQGLLLNQYANLFAKEELKVGQVLITQFDTTHRSQYLNARNTLEKLLELKAIPIVNENDTTAVEEIKFGDNDTLAALVTNLSSADLLVILTDTEGLLTSERKGGKGRVLTYVEKITPQIEAVAGGVGTKFGSGGMVTKIQAARIVTFGKGAMVIADGRRPQVLLDIVQGKTIGTFFAPGGKKISSRKLWIAFGRSSQGKVEVDEGAKEALVSQGKSLLPAGIISCQGDFEAGEAIEITNDRGEVFAKGLSNFSSAEIRKIKGLKSREVSSIFPEAASEEVIHRDCLVILK